MYTKVLEFISDLFWGNDIIVNINRYSVIILGREFVEYYILCDVGGNNDTNDRVLNCGALKTVRLSYKSYAL